MADLVGIGIVLQAQRDGDMSGIVERLRDQHATLSQDERNFLADLIEGKVKHKRGRKKSVETDSRDVDIWLRYSVLRRESVKSESAFSTCKEEFGLQRSAVTEAIARIERVLSGKQPNFRAWPKLLGAVLSLDDRESV
ncbi:MAG: hypothetical protein HKN63_02765 [Rhodobacteraceae bacterium]|nr:hypothetical protein [Paracoccaceae bacterium]